MITSSKTNRIIFFLSLLGILIAIYVLQSFLRDAPIVCVNTGCELVRKNPLSYIYGIPVPAFGLVGYTLIAIFSFLKTIKPKPSFTGIILGIAIFGVCFVSWFTYTELFVIKAICTWCAISAINMTVVLFLSFKEYLNLKYES
jgi:uncharacterized membrane protein